MMQIPRNVAVSCYTVQSGAVHRVYCTLYSSVYSVKGVVYTVQCTGCRVQCTGCGVQCTGCSVECTGCSAQCTGCSAQCTGYSVQCTGCRLYCTVCTRGFILKQCLRPAGEYFAGEFQSLRLAQNSRLEFSPAGIIGARHKIETQHSEDKLTN